jgi:hypothetical protein
LGVRCLGSDERERERERRETRVRADLGGVDNEIC